MAVTRKILGQAAPGAATPTDLYTVPAANSTIVSSIVVCNRGAAAALIRVLAAPAGVATANEHYLAYDLSVPPNMPWLLVAGITLAETDVIRVEASTADVSFTAFGEELS